MKSKVLRWLALVVAAIMSCAALDAFAAGSVPVIAHEPGYYTSLANHAVRWLKQQGVPAETVPLKDMAAKLSTANFALLVGFDSPSPAEMKILRSFRGRGGKLVVFYSSSPALAALMGIKTTGYKKAAYPGQWSKMVFKSAFPAGLPKEIRQTSTVLQGAVPADPKGRILAEWVDRKGKSSGDAAWIATTGGYWMTHVFLADGDEDLKARMLAALAGSVEPHLWNAKAADAKAAAGNAALRALALKQVPRKGEIHAVWDHSGCGLYPGNWKRTIKVLQEARVSDLFVNVAGAAFAHYPSAVLPRSRTYSDEGDQLKACIEAAKGSGIRVHAWILCFTATRGTPERLEYFKRKGWRLKDRDGKLTEYLDPANPEVRAYLLKAIDEIMANYPSISGIHLDFVRWYERANKPKNAAGIISNFVSAARKHVRRPAWLTTAVLGKYPACIASVGQDWDSWLNANLVDYVVPMNYTENSAKLEEFLAQQSAVKSHANRTIAGLGVTANESRLGAREVIGQILQVRKHGLAGVALFDLDVTLEKQILPYLKLGMW